MDLGHSSVYENVVWNEIITIAAKQEYRQWWIMSVKWIRQPLLRFIPSTKSVIGKKSENNVRKTPDDSGVFLRLLKKLRRIFRVSEKQSLQHFVAGRVPDTKYFSGCECTSCAPTAHKECAQQTAKNWRKRPQAFFDKLRKTPDDSGVFLFYPQ